MGERRLRASIELGLATIPAVIKNTADEAMLRDALLENLHRADLNPLEEASAYQQLLADFGITQDELAGRIGRSRPQITNTIRLLRLPASIQRKVAAGVLSSAKSSRASKPTAGKRQGQLNEIAERLGDRLNTRVKISLGSSKGTVVIDFATVADLNRILGELGEPGYQ